MNDEGVHRLAQAIEDIICIILLVCLPECILERFGLYESMWAIARGRQKNKS